MSDKRDIELMYEIGQMRLVDRMWKRFFHSRVANVAEHTFRVAWIALMLAKKEGVKDEAKILKMALVHDLSESRTGDVDYISRMYVERKEDQAINDIFNDTVMGQEIKELFTECEERKTLEAKIVKDADTLDVDLELMEQSAQTVTKEKRNRRKEAVRPKLFTESARMYWDQIIESNPHDWHFNGTNRFNSGDWKKN